MIGKKNKRKESSNAGNKILVICSIAVPCIICIAQIVINEFNFKNMYIWAKENENYIGAENIFNNLIEDDFINSGLAVITIAVSVWVGLNIYNNCKESYLEKQLQRCTKGT